MPTPAIFLDRDGTVIEQVHHLSKVEEVKVFQFAREALKLLKEQGFKCVIVTNQSAIGRGLLDESGLHAIHEEMIRQLGQDDLVHGIYYCPLMPISGDPTVIEDIDRKPGPGMLLRAANELDLDLNNSWMIGDAISDILSGRNAGCCGTVLVRTGYGRKTELESVAEKLHDAGCTLQAGREENRVAGCTLQVAEGTKELPQLRNFAAPQLADSHMPLLPTSGGEGGRRPNEGGDGRFEDKVARCKLHAAETIDYVTDNLLTAARLIVQLNQS